MVELLARLKGQVSVLLVEHDMDAVFALADRIAVLVTGARSQPARPTRSAGIRRCWQPISARRPPDAAGSPIAAGYGDRQVLFGVSFSCRRPVKS